MYVEKARPMAPISRRYPAITSSPEVKKLTADIRAVSERARVMKIIIRTNDGILAVADVDDFTLLMFPHLLLADPHRVADADDYHFVSFLGFFQDNLLYPFNGFVDRIEYLLAHGRNCVTNVFPYYHRVYWQMIF